MFVTKTHKRRGSISVQIISKDSGRYRVVETIGTSNDSDEAKKLLLKQKIE
jgi:hypothetical protein